MNAVVSAFTSWAVPPPTSRSSARGAAAPQISPASTPSSALPASVTANQAVARRAGDHSPGVLTCAGTVSMRDIPPRFPEDRTRETDRKRPHAAADAGAGDRTGRTGTAGRGLSINLAGRRRSGQDVGSEVTMSAAGIIVLVIILVLLIAAAAVAGILILRRLALRRRVAQLGLRPLNAEQRGKYSREWTSAQERFVDSPAEAAEAAGALVTAVAADRGYPVGDHEQLLSDLSVHHARRLNGYRRARRTTQSGAAKTEELRQALLAYRALFRDLLGPPDS